MSSDNESFNEFMENLDRVRALIAKEQGKLWCLGWTVAAVAYPPYLPHPRKFDKQLAFSRHLRHCKSSREQLCQEMVEFNEIL